MTAVKQNTPDPPLSNDEKLACLVKILDSVLGNETKIIGLEEVLTDQNLRKVSNVLQKNKSLLPHVEDHVYSPLRVVDVASIIQDNCPGYFVSGFLPNGRMFVTVTEFTQTVRLISHLAELLFLCCMNLFLIVSPKQKYDH